MSNEIFLHNKERETIKELKEAKKSYYDYYPNSLFENVPDLDKNEFKYVTSYEAISNINNNEYNPSNFGEFKLNNDIANSNIFLPNLPREPTDFISIISFPYTNKNSHRLNTNNSSNNIQSFSSNIKKKNLDSHDDNNRDRRNANSNNIFNNKENFENFQIWNQLPEKKTFLTAKSNNWDIKDKDKKIYSYENGIPFQSPYLSEVNLNLYEEIYQMYHNHRYSYGQYSKVVEEKKLIKNILNMIVGISSKYFRYDTEKEKFIIVNERIQYLRIVGCDGLSLSK